MPHLICPANGLQEKKGLWEMRRKRRGREEGRDERREGRQARWQRRKGNDQSIIIMVQIY